MSVIGLTDITTVAYTLTFSVQLDDTWNAGDTILLQSQGSKLTVASSKFAT